MPSKNADGLIERAGTPPATAAVSTLAPHGGRERHRATRAERPHGPAATRARLGPGRRRTDLPTVHVQGFPRVGLQCPLLAPGADIYPRALVSDSNRLLVAAGPAVLDTCRFGSTRQRSSERHPRGTPPIRTSPHSAVVPPAPITDRIGPMLGCCSSAPFVSIYSTGQTARHTTTRAAPGRSSPTTLLRNAAGAVTDHSS